MDSSRIFDHAGANEVHRFLIKYFYSKMPAFKEEFGKEQQIAGIDMYLYTNHKWCSVDEKAQLTRLNQNITDNTTQVLEILSKTRAGSFLQGWIYNSQTDYYLFTYITDCSVESKQTLTYDKIQRIRAILISKQQIVEMLEQQGFSLKELKNLAYKMIEEGYYTHRRGSKHDYIYFQETDKLWLCHTHLNVLPEEPVNCVIKWSLLEQYAQCVYEITPTEVLVLQEEEKNCCANF